VELLASVRAVLLELDGDVGSEGEEHRPPRVLLDGCDLFQGEHLLPPLSGLVGIPYRK